MKRRKEKKLIWVFIVLFPRQPVKCRCIEWRRQYHCITLTWKIIINWKWTSKDEVQNWCTMIIPRRETETRVVFCVYAREQGYMHWAVIWPWYGFLFSTMGTCFFFFLLLFFVCLFFLFNNSYHIKWSIQTVVSLFHLFLNKYKSDKAYHNLFLILESSDYIHCIKSNFLVPGPSNHQGTWLSKHELQTMFYCSFSIIPQGMRVNMSCAIPAHWTIEIFDYSK